jgi:hypothetical protein
VQTDWQYDCMCRVANVGDEEALRIDGAMFGAVTSQKSPLQVQSQRNLAVKVQKSVRGAKYLHETTAHAPYHECQLQRSEAAVLPVALQRFSTRRTGPPNLWGLAKRYIHVSHAKELHSSGTDVLKRNITHISLPSRGGLLPFHLFDDQANVLRHLYPASSKRTPPRQHQKGRLSYGQRHPLSSRADSRGLSSSAKAEPSHSQLWHRNPVSCNRGVQPQRLQGCIQWRLPRVVI